MEWASSPAVSKERFISYLKAKKIVSHGCIYHLLRVNESSVKVPSFQ